MAAPGGQTVSHGNEDTAFEEPCQILWSMFMNRNLPSSQEHDVATQCSQDFVTSVDTSTNTGTAQKLDSWSAGTLARAETKTFSQMFPTYQKGISCEAANKSGMISDSQSTVTDGATDSQLSMGYLPDTSLEMSEVSTGGESVFIGSALDEVKYVVFESALLLLFHTCPKCHMSCLGQIKYRRSSMICIEQVCQFCHKTSEWRNQPECMNLPVINLLLSGGILAGGLSATKVFRMFEETNIAVMTENTHYSYASRYLHPVILDMWNLEKQSNIDFLQGMGGSAIMAGDGRADSPGHCAKFGTYSLMEVRLNKVIELQVVQVSNASLLTEDWSTLSTAMRKNRSRKENCSSIMI